MDGVGEQPGRASGTGPAGMPVTVDPEPLRPLEVEARHAGRGAILSRASSIANCVRRKRRNRAIIARVAVGELNRAVGLRPLARVQSDAGDEQVAVAQLTDAGAAGRGQRGDLGLLGHGQGVGTLRGRAAVAGAGHERHVADPQRHARLGDPQFGGDLRQGPRLGPQRAGARLLGLLASVAHPPMMTAGCDNDGATRPRGSRGASASGAGGAAWPGSSTRSGGCARG